MIKIISDGNPRHTKFIDEETGSELKGISKAIYTISVHSAGELLLIFPVAKIEAIGKEYIRYEKKELKKYRNDEK